MSIFIIFLSIGFVSANDDTIDLNQDDNQIDVNNYQNSPDCENGIGDSIAYDNNEEINLEKMDYSGEISESNNVNKTNSSIELKDIEMYYKNGTKLSGNLIGGNNTTIANENVTININGVNYTRTTDENGIFSMSINLNPGLYNVTVYYAGSTSYETSEANSTLKVLPTISGDNLIKYYRNGSQFFATFIYANGTPIANTNVSFNINGVFYKRITDENGTARLNINLNPNEYILTAENPNDGLQMSYNITVLSTILSEDFKMYYKNGTRYTAKFLDDNGSPLKNKTVSININGVIYKRITDENGTVSLAINLAPGNYTVSSLNPNDNYTKANTISVLSTLVAKDIKVDFQSGGKYIVKLVDGQGNPIANETVTLNINGVFYNRTTNATGDAVLNINLNPGDYIITAMHGGLSYSSKITVNKMSAKISIVSNTIKRNSYYQAKIINEKDNKPVPNLLVYFLYEETAFAAYTDKDGIASIRVNLPPGPYQLITAIQQNAFYSDIAIYNTVTVIA
ncbi:MAG: adhesin [Methanobacteriaceae archaeon]|nr:adhesin [Methanobacteriaceae archaeon]